MEAPEERTEHQSSVERTTSPILVARVAKLILATTALSALLFPFVLEPAELSTYLPGTAVFASIYAIVWLLAIRGWPLLAAWIFLTLTYAGQIGVILATGAVTEQMLVSFVNLILATGFILGRRIALVVSAVCSISVVVIWLLFMMGAMPEAVIVPTESARLVTIICTLLATAGLTYFGVEFLTLAVERAEVHADQAGVALAALERQQEAEYRRTNRAERLGIMARNLVGQRDPESLTTEVAVGLRDALDAQIVLILGRSGRILATAGLGDIDPPDEVLPTHADRLVEQGAFQVLKERHRVPLAEELGVEQPELVMAARGPHTAVTVLVLLGQGQQLEPTEAQWPIQVAANLLDSAMIRHESERRMLQVQKMDALNRLSSGIAHDFNNLLTTILGGAELLEHKADPSDPIQAHLKRIREAGERAASLTVKLMTFTRGAPRAREFVELGVLVSDLYPVLRRTLEENIHIELHPVTDTTWVDADPVEIERIILNLVANARDALGDAGRIDIGVDLRPAVDGGPTIVLWVQDNGEGMDLDTRTRVFEPFFTTRKGKGATGLGLSIVYGVAQALGGDVFIDSTRGTGTCVEVHLPALLEPPAQPAATTQVKSTAAGAPILVVEDDPDVRDTVCEMLRLGGYLPEAVDSGEAALERLESKKDYCLVLSDVIMPTMSGFDLAHAMDEQGYAAPIALISGYAKGDTSSTEDVAPLPRITKPFSLNELLTFVQAHSA